MFINLFIKFLFIIIVTLKLTSCGSGDTRKLTTEEIIYNPKDKSRLGQMQKGGDFLSGIIGGNVEFVEFHEFLGKRRNS